VALRRGVGCHGRVVIVLLMIVMRVHRDAVGCWEGAGEAREGGLGRLGVAVEVAGSGLELRGVGVHGAWAHGAEGWVARGRVSIVREGVAGGGGRDGVDGCDAVS
jgi:hypothetical protein